MTTVEEARIKRVERQKRIITRRIRKALRGSYSECCVISTRGLFDETIEWLEKLGYRVYLLEE